MFFHCRRAVLLFGLKHSVLVNSVSLGLLAPALATEPPAQAASEPVYRCGNSYSTRPCPGGTVVDVADPRSPAQQQEARQAAQRDAALARQMQADRLADERAASARDAAQQRVTAAKSVTKPATKPAAKPAVRWVARRPAKAASGSHHGAKAKPGAAVQPTPPAPSVAR